MQDSRLGTKNVIAGQRLDLLLRVFQGEALMVPPVWSEPKADLNSEDSAGGRPTMFFVAPVKNNAGEVIAAVSHQIEPADDFTRLAQLGRMGKTGETYAFDSYGRLLSESRFDEALRQFGLHEVYAQRRNVTRSHPAKRIGCSRGEWRSWHNR